MNCHWFSFEILLICLYCVLLMVAWLATKDINWFDIRWTIVKEPFPGFFREGRIIQINLQNYKTCHYIFYLNISVLITLDPARKTSTARNASKGERKLKSNIYCETWKKAFLVTMDLGTCKIFKGKFFRFYMPYWF